MTEEAEFGVGPEEDETEHETNEEEQETEPLRLFKGKI